MKGRRFQERWLAVVVPLLFYAADVALTWGKQPPNLTKENVYEFNPVVARAMVAGLGSVLLLETVWVLVIVVPVLLLPRLWAVGYSYAWTFGHAAAVMIWLAYPFGYGFGYWSLYWYCPIVAFSLLLVGMQMFRPMPSTVSSGTLPPNQYL
jgi:hypothetical protein